MSDPMTIGALAAQALAMGAEAAIKVGVGEAVKDAYKALKNKIITWAGGDVEALEKEPTSKGRQIIVSEKIDQQSPDDQIAVEALAKKLVELLERDHPVGFDIGRLQTWRADFDTIEVSRGTFFCANEVVAAEFSVKNAKVGN